MKFCELLELLIEKTGLSKNTILQESSIDRSTFYQILKGKRLPTYAQLARLSFALHLTKEEYHQLRMVYEQEKSGEEESQIVKFHDLLLAVNEDRDWPPERGTLRGEAEDADNASPDAAADTDVRKTAERNERSAAPERLREDIHREFQRRGSIDMFFSLPVSMKWRLHSVLRMEAEAAAPTPGQVRIRQIWSTELELGKCGNPASMEVRDWLEMTSHDQCILNSYEYRLRQSCRALEVEPYPYYIFGSDWGYFISVDGNYVQRVEDENMLRYCRENFERVLQSARSSLFHSREDYWFERTRLTGQRRNKAPTFLVYERPCLLPYMNEDMFSRTTGRRVSVYRKAQKSFLASDYVQITRREGIEAIAQGRVPQGCPCAAGLDPVDYQRIAEQIQSELGKSILVPVFSTCFLRGWGILIRKGTDVTLFREDGRDAVVHIVNPSLVEVFYQYYAGIVEMLRERNPHQL